MRCSLYLNRDFHSTLKTWIPQSEFPRASLHYKTLCWHTSPSSKLAFVACLTKLISFAYGLATYCNCLSQVYAYKIFLRTLYERTAREANITLQDKEFLMAIHRFHASLAGRLFGDSVSIPFLMFVLYIFSWGHLLGAKKFIVSNAVENSFARFEKFSMWN